MPNTLRVLVKPRARGEREFDDLTFQVGELECLRAFVGEGQFLERYQDNAVLCPIVVSQSEISFREFRVSGSFDVTTGPETTRRIQGRASVGIHAYPLPEL